ncbi:MAG TPA: hypothetical protein VJN32_03135 [Dehalococcoidia bacterium]|nr:hypothetical protein [Dehalococcoidia bacterium]
MDAEMLYRAKLQEMELEARKIRLVAAAKDAGSEKRPTDSGERCRSIPRLLRALRPAS